MGLDIFKTKGTPLDRQAFTWRELAGPTYSKLDEDAFTRVRVILMNGIEAESVRFSHACARMNGELQAQLARVRRIEQHQQTLVNWLNPADQSPLETTLGFEQVAIEVTACVARREPHPYLAQVYRFGLLEDFDHLYRFSALYDRLEGKDANTILQSYTDILPGRPTVVEHRDPLDDLRKPYDRNQVEAITKLHALTIVAAEHQVHDYYMTIGPMFSDPLARQLYAEIASIEEQHVTQYECLVDPRETWLEKWLLHEAGEVYTYWSCVESERNPRLRAIWERLLDYELGHLQHVRRLFEEEDDRDVHELLPTSLPAPIDFTSQRDFIRNVLKKEVGLRPSGTEFDGGATDASQAYAKKMNREGSPSETVADGWAWMPGTELAAGETVRNGNGRNGNGQARSTR